MSVKDLVLIEGLEIRTVIGIYDWEREIRQMVRLDLEMAWDISLAGKSDDIADTLDYKAVSKRLIAFVEASSFGLIESLAEQCARILLDEFNVPWLRLKLSKPGAVRGSENVAVLIERGVR
jgi:dihydroneopterin aldolase